jgi:hypothetical protein
MAAPKSSNGSSKGGKSPKSAPKSSNGSVKMPKKGC